MEKANWFTGPGLMDGWIENFIKATVVLSKAVIKQFVLPKSRGLITVLRLIHEQTNARKYHTLSKRNIIIEVFSCR